jgi:3',5'-cyclic AMP phosphodiesterase CpdA
MDQHKEPMTLTRRWLRLGALLALLLALCLPALAEYVVIAGDSRNDTNGILPKIVQAANATKGVRFMIYLGDMTATGSVQEFANYKKTVKPLKMPLYAIPGNHERAGDGNYERLVGPAYYTHQMGRWRFIMIDNSRSRLGAEQLAWVKKELEDASAKHDYIVLAMHEPLWCPIAGDHVMGNPDRDILLGWAKKYGVKLVAGAHYHSYFLGTHDGITHLTTGGAGAPLYGPIAFYHYVLADFKSDGTFKLTAIRVKGK